MKSRMEISQYTLTAYFLSAMTLIVNSYNLDTEFPIILRGKPGSYFGYTVALHYNREGPMALVGAPRANSSDDTIHEPGALYKCAIRDKNTCREVVLDKKGNFRTEHLNSVFSYHEMKDGMWLGVSLDVLKNSARTDIVTCGHLWKNQHYGRIHLTNGVCYVIGGDLDSSHVIKLLPFVERSSTTRNRYAFGQVGTSAAFSEDGKYLLLGAPGYYFWTGTVATYGLDPGKGLQEYTSPDVPEYPNDQNVSPDSYIGYSVTSGKFFDGSTEYVAVGAPRDSGLNGRVYVYDPQRSARNKRITTHQRLEGSQLGEYFGASVLGVDLNNDGHTDLLVGSPLYYSALGVDEGKVYVFVSNGIGLMTSTELVGLGSSNARFGTSIANIGDLNQDGYNDVAIGAPYENQKGVVYIYHGSKTGLMEKFAQRISASEIDPSLSGFGIHISTVFDVDGNQYPDVLIGAYASASAVLFRAKPIHQLHAKVTYSPKRINMINKQCNFRGEDVPCVDITACLRYTGKHVPVYLNFHHSLFLVQEKYNAVSPRGFFIHDTRSTSILSHTSNLNFRKDYCFKSKLHIRSDIKDRVTPIQLLYRYQLVESNSKSFNKTHPIIDPSSSTNEYPLSIPFQIGCGRDNKCQSDLLLSMEILGNNDSSNLFVIGETTTVSLTIEAVNLGEPAYLSELLIYLPPELPSINHGICRAVLDQTRNASLECDLGNPLKMENNVLITIKLDLTKIPTDIREVSVVFEALTVSDDVNLTNNHIEVSLGFRAIADISVTGSPAQEQIQYDRFSDEAIPVTISHTYFVMNHGPSPVQLIDIALFIPVSLKGTEFVTFTSIETENGKPLSVPATCNDTYIDFNPISLDKFKDERTMEENGKNHTETYFDFEYPSKTRRRRNVNGRKLKRKGNDLVIDCETTKCVAIHCSASPFSDSRKFAKITVVMLVNMTIVNGFRKEWNRLEFVTHAMAQIRDGEDFLSKSEYNRHPDRAIVNTTVVSSARPAPEEPSNWIIFASIGMGVLLLLIILGLLIKFGFFRRQKKDLMEKIKRETCMQQNLPEAEMNAGQESLS